MTRLVLWLQARPLLTLAGIGAYLVLMVATAGFSVETPAWWVSWRGKFPVWPLAVTVGAAGLIALAWLIFRQRGGLTRLVVFYWLATLFMLGVACFLLFATHSKALHLLPYVLLGMALFVLTGRALDTLLWLALAAFGAEGLQYWVVKRDWGIYFDFNDLVFAVLGGAVGVLTVLSTVNLERTGLPRPPRPAWRAPSLWLITLVVLGSAALGRIYPYTQAPGAGDEPWFVLTRTAMPGGFWHQEAWSRTFHVLGPVEALVWLALIIGFYALLDYLARPTDPADIRYLDRLHGLLVRVTRSTPYMAPVDGMRFIAILSVVLFHLEFLIPREAIGGEGIRQFLGYGNIGVQFFFAVSGFILAVPMLKDRLLGEQRIGLGRYYLRRLTRIEPPYLICLALLVLLGLTTHPGPDEGRHFLASAFYVHGLAYDTFSTINFVAWSLEVEIQFYLLMPFIAWVFFRGDRPWLRRVLLAAACLPFMLYQSMLHDHFPHGLFFIDQVQFFVAGIIVADCYVCGLERRANPTHRDWRFDLLATLAIAVVPWIIHIDWQTARYVTPLAIGLWMHGVLQGALWRRFLGNRWLAVIGGMCYTIYLYHFLVLSGTLSLIGGFPFVSTWANLLLAGPVLLALVLAVSAVLYLAFEKPFMRGLRAQQPERDTVA